VAATAVVTMPVAASAATVGAAKPTPSSLHVFLINLENKSYAETWGSGSVAPYLATTLRRRGLFLPNYYAIGHVSLPNYIAEVSGQGPSKQTQGDCATYTPFSVTGMAALGQVLGNGCVYPTSVQSIADQLTAKGLTWKSYQEDMANSTTEPATCRHPVLGQPDPTLVARPGDQYATRHNPFVYFQSIVGSPACNTDVVDLSALRKDLASTTPNFSFITPNLCDDGHDSPCVDGRPGGLVSANAFLQTWVPRITSSPAYKKGGVLVITFDEAETGTRNGDSSACCQEPPAPNVAQAGGNGPGGGQVGALILSPTVKPNRTDATPYNHYALLCGLETAFGLAHLGYAGQPGLQCVAKGVLAHH
jgi:phosphatidylinositol-3-phosphatase